MLVREIIEKFLHRPSSLVVTNLYWQFGIATHKLHCYHYSLDLYGLGLFPFYSSISFVVNKDSYVIPVASRRLS